MKAGSLLILGAATVGALLAERTTDVLHAVERAYVLHSAGDSDLPHSVFLRFPHAPRNRIIALPAFLGGEYGATGVKWVASFPANLAAGLPRASAVIVLNSATTGQPLALLEGAQISAQRTAASAALAAVALHAGREPSLGLLGGGVINYEIVRYLAHLQTRFRRVTICDLDAARAAQFQQRIAPLVAPAPVECVPDAQTLLARSRLLALATTAAQPHLLEPSWFQPGSTVLHVSLRDLAPAIILPAFNVVDDADHVCRAATSLHLTEQAVGQRNFIHCTLADLLTGRASAPTDSAQLIVFSPFGLGVLDLAVAQLVFELAQQRGLGTCVPDFL